MTAQSDPTGIYTPFRGTKRFKVLGQLGEGATSVVWRVRDRTHGDELAVKTLKHLDPSSLYRLKQEFRALSHFDHPNLVSFYELIQDENDVQGWFVTMEMVQGVDFLTFVRGPQQRQEDAAYATKTSSTFSMHGDAIAAGSGGAAELVDELPHAKLPDMAMLRSTLRQLTEAITTLHAAGRIHRDLKPGNVLVTPAGRLVVLDFGLVAEVDQDYTEGTLLQNIAGSAAYMSPEQSVGRPLTEASDWYSVGVMLYEALTGQWPFRGHLYQILSAKQEADPTPPNRAVPTVPAEWSDLCMALLRRQPSQRAGAAEVHAMLAGRSVQAARPALNSQPRFRFREAQLRTLVDSWRFAREGNSTVVVVTGAEGSGKSAIVRELVKGLKRKDDPFTLKGRCFEWEQLPFKALDGAIDNLTRAIRRLDHRAARSLQHDDLEWLAVLFPVLRRVDNFDLSAPIDLARTPQPEVHRRAFNALVHVFRTLGAQRPLLLHLDDLQWGDAPSADLLGHLLAGNRDLPLLTVLSAREGADSPFLNWLLPGLTSSGITVHPIQLGSLRPEEAAALVGELLGQAPGDPGVQAIVHQSQGLPRYLIEGARQQAFQSVRASVAEHASDLTEELVQAIHALPVASQRLLSVLALTHEPLSTENAMRAANVTTDAFAAITNLRAHQLARVTGAHQGDTLEIGSEAVREYVLDQVPDLTRQTLHATLAATLEHAGTATPETLIHHYAGAGQGEKAGVIAWLAAQQAFSQRRFTDAAWLLERAHSLGTFNPHELRTLRGALGEALGHIGRWRSASVALAEAAKDAAPIRRTELRRQEAAFALAAGDVEHGLQLVNALLTEAGQPSLGAQRRGLFATAAGFVGLGRGRRALTFTAVPAERCPPEALLRIDLLHTAAVGMLPVDGGRFFALQRDYLQVALEVGEPFRARRALALDVLTRNVEEGEAASQALAARVTAEATAAHDHGALAGTLLGAALVSFERGRWTEAARAAHQANQIGQRHGVFSPSEKALCGWLVARSQWQRGELVALRALVAGPADDPKETPLWAALRGAGVVAWLRLTEGEDDRAAQLIEDATEGTAAGAAPALAWLAAAITAHLMQGQPSLAWDLIQARWRGLDPNLSAAFAPLVLDAWLCRGRAALAMALAGGPRAELLREAEAALLKARGLELEWAGPWCDLLGAAIAAANGQPSTPQLDSAGPAFQKGGMSLGTAATAYARASGLGARRDAALAPALRWFEAQGINHPDRLVDALAPGLGAPR